MDSWKRLKEESLPDKESFYIELNNEYITDGDYAHAQKVWSTFNIKNLGEYHDLYVQSDTALLADVFENFRDKWIEIYELDPAHFLSAPGLAWQACLKKTKVELELLTGNDMLIMFEERTRGGMCLATYRYAKANNKYMKNHDKNKESAFLKYLDANNLYGHPMCKKLPVGDFKWVDDLSIFTEDFIKNYDENSDKGYIFEVYVEYPKDLHKVHSDLPFLPERMKINKRDKLVSNVRDKENYVIHILALKQALNHGLKLTKVQRVIEFRAFMEYSNDMHDVYKNINNYNPDKENKILIVFDDMIADMINNKKLNLVVTELFIRGRKLNISIIFITQSYFKVPKEVRLNTTHFFIMKIPNKREL